MLEIVGRFCLDGEPLLCTRYGSGHINDTYLLVDSTGRQYILQKINRMVFRDPEALMRNILAVTTHLRKSAASSREVLTLLPAQNGDFWLCDEQGEYWRLYAFVSDNLCLERPQSPEDFRESARAFGRFQRQLADFPAHSLTETIPHFHDTPVRYAALRQALQNDSHGRAAAVRREAEFALAREEYAATLVRLQAEGSLPLRVTHNDTKLNNVLFDRESRKALCVIDLDTVMPGLAVNDFGDSIRFGASTAPEDEPDPGKVGLSLPLFEAYVQGFLAACESSLTKTEIDCLCDGAKMMTLECGVRFLTDYLMGDVYFRTHREDHNLVRCRTQFRLVADMESKWDTMQEAVAKQMRS